MPFEKMFGTNAVGEGVWRKQLLCMKVQPLYCYREAASANKRELSWLEPLLAAAKNKYK